MNQIHTLAGKFVLLILAAGAASIIVFFALQTGGNMLIADYFETADSQEHSVERRLRLFQEYVSKNGLSTTDTVELKNWTRKHPVILLEIYRSNQLIYSSLAYSGKYSEREESDIPYYDWYAHQKVTFSDGDADVILYADDAYRWYTSAMIAEIIFCLVLFLAIFLKGSRGIVVYVCQLRDEIETLEGGNLDVPITIQGNTEISDLARSLNSMRLAFKEQRENEAAFFHANQTMITEMSHDLRTPLTTLLIYTEILLYQKYEGQEELKAYLKKIDTKAREIKQLSDNIFEYSLISKNREVKLDAPKSFREIFHDLLSESAEYLEQRGYTLKLEMNWREDLISIYPQYIKRLMDNVVSNIIKYADPAAPVEIEIIDSDFEIGIVFSNRIKQETQEQESAQIGLTNMRTMMEKMNGQCVIVPTNKEFMVELLFPKQQVTIT